MAIIIGIDPGNTGGIARLDTDSETLTIAPMPVIKTGTASKPELDEDMVIDMLSGASHIFLEHAQAMPKNGAVSMFNYGTGFGQLKMASRVVRCPRTLIRPANWMKALEVKGKKGDGGDAIFGRAIELMPLCRPLFVSQYKRGGAVKETRKDGLIDAAMIAYYGALSSGVQVGLMNIAPR